MPVFLLEPCLHRELGGKGHERGGCSPSGGCDGAQQHDGHVMFRNNPTISKNPVVYYTVMITYFILFQKLWDMITICQGRTKRSTPETG